MNQTILTESIRMATIDSEWNSSTWRWPNTLVGQRRRKIEIDWDIELIPGQRLMDPEWSTLLEELRSYIYTSINDPRSGRPLGLGSIEQRWVALKLLAEFMACESYSSLGELHCDSSWEFMAYLEENYEEGNEGAVGATRKKTHSSMVRSLHVLPRLWRQREAMNSVGVNSLLEEPFGGKTSFQVVNEEMRLKRKGGLKPIPDEVAFPIMNAATRYIGLPADDVIKLQKDVLEALGYDYSGENGRSSTPLQYAIARELIREREFSPIGKDSSPWRESISLVDRTYIDGRSVKLSEIQGLRRAVLTIVAASCTALQSGTGIRAHEICGLQDTSSDEEKYPSCLYSTITRDGLLECFYLKGRTAKRGKSRDVEWLVGSRPAGSSYVPPPVRALQVLKEILHPWRRLAQTTDLLMTFAAAKGLPRSKESIGHFGSCYLTNLQKEFVHECVTFENLNPALHREFVAGNGLRGHRWRTTFATQIYTISSGLLPALRDHFKHLSVATTEYGYIGSDPTILESCESAQTLSTARAMLSFSTGQVAMAGSMTSMVSRHHLELKALIDKKSGDTDEQRAVAFVKDNGIQLFNSSYVRCFITLMPHKSSCHSLAGTPTILRNRPANQFRSESICARCRASAILLEHLPHWENELEESEALLRRAKQSSPERLKELRVEVGFADMARRIVKALKAKIAGSGKEQKDYSK